MDIKEDWDHRPAAEADPCKMHDGEVDAVVSGDDASPEDSLVNQEDGDDCPAVKSDACKTHRVEPVVAGDDVNDVTVIEVEDDDSDSDLQVLSQTYGIRGSSSKSVSQTHVTASRNVGFSRSIVFSHFYHLLHYVYHCYLCTSRNYLYIKYL